jgi:N-terminal acetyltransferase 2
MLRLPQQCIRLGMIPRASRQFTTLRTTQYAFPRSPLVPSRRIASPRRFYAAEAKTAEPIKPSSPNTANEAKLPVTERLKILFKKYRWPALTVYLGLSVIDFGVAFLAVQAFGTERIGRYEKIILNKLEEKTGWKRKGTAPEHLEPGSSETASIWTQITLAWAIHKTLFALIRVPLTVAITPSLVKWFNRKGYGVVLAQMPAIGRLFQNNTSAVAARK